MSAKSVFSVRYTVIGVSLHEPHTIWSLVVECPIIVHMALYCCNGSYCYIMSVSYCAWLGNNLLGTFPSIWLCAKVG